MKKIVLKVFIFTSHQPEHNFSLLSRPSVERATFSISRALVTCWMDEARNPSEHFLESVTVPLAASRRKVRGEKDIKRRRKRETETDREKEGRCPAKASGEV